MGKKLSRKKHAKRKGFNIAGEVFGRKWGLGRGVEKKGRED